MTEVEFYRVGEAKELLNDDVEVVEKKYYEKLSGRVDELEQALKDVEAHNEKLYRIYDDIDDIVSDL